MIRFKYEAARADGHLVHGTVDALYLGAALEILTDRRLTPTMIVEDSGPRHRMRVRRGEVAVLLRGVSALLVAGVPLDRALGSVVVTAKLGEVVEDVRRRVREGEPLSSALGAQPAIPPLATALVRAGERADLAAALEQAAETLEREAEVARRVSAALAYPALLLAAGSVAVAVLVTSVLPRFARMLGDLGADLPASTRLLLRIAQLPPPAWAGALGVVVVAAAFALRWLRSPTGYETLLAIPILGTVQFQFATARAARAMAALLAQGAPALTALNAAAEAAGDAAIRERLRRAGERVRTGATLGQAIEAERALTREATQLVLVGEQAGTLPRLLGHAARTAEDDATRRVDAGVRLLEPAMILGFGVVVAVVALALLQAVYGLRIA